ncbi:MAG: HAD-IIA family hydrolase [Promethearchaeota archaeon]|nr:MAG: HAD-IIA family hydrolase [Candidatus Lokiarchaeota archaeon]
MRQLIDELKDIKLAIFDLDGVVYRGKKLIKDTDKIIQELKDQNIRVVYNSNNSTATRQMYVERLENFNILSDIHDFYTSASITAEEISKVKSHARIFVIGEVGLREELKAKGHEIVNEPLNYNEIDFVIVGLDRNFNYKALTTAQNCIMEGNAEFYATNSDATLPAAKGFLPGAGVMVGALEICTSKSPKKIFGKPNSYGIKLILKNNKVHAKNACIFGDRLETDILAGNRAGIYSIAVLTGVVSNDHIEELKNNLKDKIDGNLLPDLVLDSLNDIFK